MRLRIAPSPTGILHLGNLYSVLANVLFSHKYNSKLILRIEDTDIQRNKINAIENIYEDLNKIRVNIDESSKNPGLYGPYKQTERIHIYKFYIKKLLKMGGCFFCKCSFKRVNILKKINLLLGDPPTYDGKCLNRNYLTGKIRLKVPKTGICVGDYKINWSNVDMQVLWANSKPTYHFANVIDDQLMKISHVLRGRDWLTSFPKHILINSFLGFNMPKYYHIPLICNKTESKLSKRLDNMGIDSFLSLGIISEAILRYLISLIVCVDVSNISEASSYFNINKLKQQNIHINGKKLILINKMCLHEVVHDVNNVIKSLIREGCFDNVMELCVKKSLILHDTYKLLCFVFWDYKSIKMIFMSNIEYLLLNLLLIEYKKLIIWSKISIQNIHKKITNYLGLKTRTFCTILTPIIGNRHSISLYDVYLIIGQKVVITRISLILEKIYNKLHQHI
ncbi:Glutamate--tRNA ligase [Candidatus Hodgkinia cicadicola]|nr:Glutamate--tRNA ligase [Candidatus Hodgkinia cicadicola]